MSILDIVLSWLSVQSDVKVSVLPDAPDALVSLREYSGRPPDQYFDGIGYHYSVQVLCRALTYDDAHSRAQQVQSDLQTQRAGYLIVQSAGILDIGQDERDRRECTINYKITEL